MAERVNALFDRLNMEAEKAGYHLNPDREFVNNLLEGLLVNEDRYGYHSCPCRLSSGVKARDLDLICPCDYRDPDLAEYGACYCALYVSEEVLQGKRKLGSIPERRPPGGPTAHEVHDEEWEPVKIANLPFPVWRCKVCGYLCARPTPPERCPICHVTKERFERFM
jgi:ferredoxin-thioredoxin reductase catalytic subunit